MKIAIVAPSSVPFVRGGAERLYEGLLHTMNEAGHEAELIKLPSREHSFHQLVESYGAFAALDLSHFDLVVSTKYPSWMVRHPRHVVYMVHPLRGLYDTYPQSLSTEVVTTSPVTDDLVRALDEHRPGDGAARAKVLGSARAVTSMLPHDHPDLAFPGPLVRRLVRWLDTDGLDPRYVRRHMAISRRVTQRPGYFPDGVAAEAVIPPSSLTGFHSGGFDAFFTASRLDSPKRIDLLIEAMRSLPAEARLRIAGEGPESARLHRLAAGDPRIVFLGRVDDDQLRNEYSNALAVPFVPYDEDLGLIALEAHIAGKPVITCTDSGGTLEIVSPNDSAFVVPPTAFAIGEAMQRLLLIEGLAEAMGEHGRRRAELVTWEHVLDELTDPSIAETDHPLDDEASPSTPRIVVLCTYGAFPPEHGGQVRLSHLCRGLAYGYEVHLLGLAGGSVASGHQRIGPTLHQWATELSPEQGAVETMISSAVGVSTIDITATLAIDKNKPYMERAAALLDGAIAVVLEHPYLLPVVETLCPDIPIILDCQNVEAELKRTMYPESAPGIALADAVDAVERRALARADLVVACTQEDRELLGQLAPSLADFVVVPNGTDLTMLEFVTGADRRSRGETYLRLVGAALGQTPKHLAVFVGSAHRPNAQAAELLVQLAPRMDDTLFVLVGGHTDMLDARDLPPNVMLGGVVPRAELDALLTSCDVAVNPMISGSGSNIKLLNYFAHGAPTVTTPTGARGFPLDSGRHALIVPPDHLVAAIRAVLDDSGLRTTMPIAARAFAEAHSWSALGFQFKDAVDRLLMTEATDAGVAAAPMTRHGAGPGCHGRR